MNHIINSFLATALSIAAAFIYATGDAESRGGLLLTASAVLAAWCAWHVVAQVVFVGRVKDRRRV